MKTLKLGIALIALAVGFTTSAFKTVDQSYVWFDVQDAYKFEKYATAEEVKPLLSGVAGKIGVGYLLSRKDIPATNPFRTINSPAVNQVLAATLYLQAGQPVGTSAVIDLNLYR